MLVPQCRVSSSEASRKTIQRRSHCLSTLRTAISGGESPDIVTQLRSEIRCLSKEDRQELLQSAGLPVVIPPDHALATKADLSIPWSKLRVIRRQVNRHNNTISIDRYAMYIQMAKDSQHYLSQ